MNISGKPPLKSQEILVFPNLSGICPFIFHKRSKINVSINEVMMKEIWMLGIGLMTVNAW
ncbi:hypothetical protein WQ57_06245 [Mesobacillus campisalis]|uniref:Uncharacterized protein n=1 Tax=Mesobacillus campisalis TaxID=1408103 RepID=A0A0M2SXP5_9BACI|nr:hypothetical protein WQ57_06245 [Mesobacillus campisalis]